MEPALRFVSAGGSKIQPQIPCPDPVRNREIVPSRCECLDVRGDWQRYGLSRQRAETKGDGTCRLDYDGASCDAPPAMKHTDLLTQILAFLWIASIIFSCACATSGRFGKNVMKSRYSTSACLNVPCAYHASAMASFARGTSSGSGQVLMRFSSTV